MTIAIICTSVLGALVFVLGANVTRIRAMRGKNGGTQTPSDPADALLKAIRAHGNASEYVPTLAVLILLVAWRSPGAWAAILAIGAMSARLLHAVAMLRMPTMAARSRLREVGALGTYLFGLGLAVTAVTTIG
jgi:uncharacterized membrane protein YecN with MAPEG domain